MAHASAASLNWMSRAVSFGQLPLSSRALEAGRWFARFSPGDAPRRCQTDGRAESAWCEEVRTAGQRRREAVAPARPIWTATRDRGRGAPVVGTTFKADACAGIWALSSEASRRSHWADRSVSANNGDLLVRLVLNDEEVALVPRFVVDDDLGAGRLVEILPGWSVPEI